MNAETDRARRFLDIFLLIPNRRIVGVSSTPSVVACGTTSRSRPIRLASIVALRLLIPVTLPPGRARLATRPLPTGSTPKAVITGIVRLAAAAARAATSPPTAINTTTGRCTNSAAIPANWS